MCGIFNDVFDFVKDSVGEIFKHPGEALGAAFGIPGYDPFFGGLFNSEHALLSPTGNFTDSAWQDMYNDHPDDGGALSLFHGINSVADKVAPAAAGYFAAPAAGAGAFGEGAGSAAGAGDALGGAAFSTGLGDTASTLGGLESGLGGASLLGPAAGTGTALGAAAQGLGAGGLGIAGPSALGGLTASAGTYAGALGGGNAGTGLGGFSGGAQMPTTPVSGGANSLEGSQALANGASGTTPGMPPPEASNLSTMYGPESTAAGSPMGSSILGNTSGVGGAVQNGALGAGSGTGAGMNVGDLESLFKLAKSGYGAYQQWNQGQKAQDYMDSIRGLFSPGSAYAQQMQQTLARSDAAAGRNSQYGTRSVQLAAALAQAQAQAMGNSNYAAAAQNASKGNMLNSLFSNFSSPGQLNQLYNLGTAGFNGLASLFG